MKGRSPDDSGSRQNRDARDTELFAAWIEQSADNVKAYLREISITVELQGLDAEHTFDLDTIVAQAKADLAGRNFEGSEKEIE